jgi:hypothetical protein
VKSREKEVDARLRLVIRALVVAETDLHRKKVSIPSLRILHYPQADILVAKCLELPHGLSKLVRILGLLFGSRRPYRRSQVVDLTHVAVGSTLGRRVIRTIRVILEVVVVAVTDEVAVPIVHDVVSSILAVPFSSGGVTTINIVIVIAIVAIIVVCSLLSVRMEVGVVSILFAERILETSASRCVNELSGPAASVGLEEHDRGKVKAIVLGREDGFITGPVLDEQEQQVVGSSHRFRFGRRVELELDS